MDDRWVNASTMAVAGAGCGVVATAVMSTVMVGWRDWPAADRWRRPW